MQYLGISPNGPYLGITTNVAEKKIETHMHDRLTDTSNYHIKNITHDMGEGKGGNITLNYFCLTVA